MSNLEEVKHHLQNLLTPKLCLAVYRNKFSYAPGAAPSGAVAGHAHFEPKDDYKQAFYDLAYHQAILPISRLPLASLLAFDMTEILPAPTAPEYPEHCLGLISILDQSRLLTTDYGRRYTCAFFDPISEKLARQLVALPEHLRPDGKQAWLSRGYTIDDWLLRTLWFWAPLVHSDTFMTADRAHLKEWLHFMRAEVEAHCGYADPFAPDEAQDDVDITLFAKMVEQGSPWKSYADAEKEATMADYSFWWIRILNAHFAITDMCGHYPYWIRWRGQEFTEKDQEFMAKTGFIRYNPKDEPTLEQVRKDHLAGVWQPLEPVPQFENGQPHDVDRNTLDQQEKEATNLQPHQNGNTLVKLGSRQDLASSAVQYHDCGQLCHPKSNKESGSAWIVDRDGEGKVLSRYVRCGADCS